jgi:hypothetical protein
MFFRKIVGLREHYIRIRRKWMVKNHSAQRADELQVLISTVKIKHKLTNAQLAKKIGTPLGTFNYWKSHIERFPVGKIWLLEVMAEK